MLYVPANRKSGHYMLALYGNGDPANRGLCAPIHACWANWNVRGCITSNRTLLGPFELKPGEQQILIFFRLFL